MPGLTQQLEGWGRRKPPPGVEIDRTHRLSRGLIGGWLFNEGGGVRVYDMTKQNPPGALLGFASMERARGPDGLVLPFDGVDDLVNILHTPILMPSQGLSIACRLQATGAPPAAFDFVVGKVSSDSWADGYGIFWNSPSVLRGFVNQYSVAYAEFSGIDPALWHTVVLTYDRQAVRLYVDGVQGATSLASSAAIIANTAPVNIGQAATSTYNFRGNIDWLYLWNRALHPGEIQLVARYPYDMLAQPPPRRFLSVPGAPSVTAADTLSLEDLATLTAAVLVAADSLSLADAASLGTLLAVSDSLTLLDLAGLALEVAATESLSLADAASVALALAAAEGFTLTDAALAALVLPPGVVDPGATCDYDAVVLTRNYDAAVICPTGEEWDAV